MFSNSMVYSIRDGSSDDEQCDNIYDLDYININKIKTVECYKKHSAELFYKVNLNFNMAYKKEYDKEVIFNKGETVEKGYNFNFNYSYDNSSMYERREIMSNYKSIINLFGQDNADKLLIDNFSCQESKKSYTKLFNKITKKVFNKESSNTIKFITDYNKLKNNEVTFDKLYKKYIEDGDAEEFKEKEVKFIVKITFDDNTIIEYNFGSWKNEIILDYNTGQVDLKREVLTLDEKYKNEKRKLLKYLNIENESNNKKISKSK